MKHLNLNESDSARKILFTGLDDAGKTSIILTLRREFEKIAIITPTRGAQKRIFTYLGMGISEWDLGGQISYRISYLKNPSNYFDKTEIAIYVVDIQNKGRFQESIDYLNAVIDQFKKLEINPPIYVFLHKMDPPLLEDETAIRRVVDHFKNQVKSNVLDCEPSFHETSIYDSYTIISTVSKIMSRLSSVGELIDDTIQAFAKKEGAYGAVLINDNSIVVGSYYRDGDMRRVLHASVPHLLTLNDIMDETKGDMGNFEHTTSFQKLGKHFILAELLISNVSRYYLVLVKDRPFVHPDSYHSLAVVLQDIISNR